MRTAVSFIEHHRKRGSGVYIHCKSGRGRSAAIAMAWLLEVKKMRPLEANQHLLRARRVRPKLFLQKNIIQFYEGLKETAMSVGGRPTSEPTDGQMGGAEFGRPARTISFATPHMPTNRRNSSAIARDVLRNGMFTSFRKGVAGEQSAYAYDAAPPDWDLGPRDGGGVWEINVAPLEPVIPDHLPAWALEQQNEQQRQLRAQQQSYGRTSPAARTISTLSSHERPQLTLTLALTLILTLTLTLTLTQAG